MQPSDVFYLALFGLALLPAGFLVGCLVCMQAGYRVGSAPPPPSAEANRSEQFRAACESLVMKHAEAAFRSFSAVTADLHRDVGRHGEQIAAATTTLSGLAPEDVERAVALIVESNTWLQGQLLTAQATIKHQQQELEQRVIEANSDGLTGISNRRAFDMELQRQLARWHRYGAHFTLILFDIDCFKNVNDQFGHLAGDAVLRATSELIRGNLREVDFAARFGGEEFAAILPDTDHEGALVAGERIRKAIAAAEIPWDDEAISVTVSVGIAGLSHLDTVEALIARADEALYISKRAGRNRTSLASYTPPPEEVAAAKAAASQAVEAEMVC